MFHPFDLDWVAYPRTTRRDPFSSLMHSLDEDIRRNFQQTLQSAGQGLPGADKNAQEYSHSYSSIQDGNRFASKKTVRMKDTDGREEIVEERCLDGKKMATRTSNVPQLQGGQQQQQQQQQLQQPQQQQIQPQQQGTIVQTEPSGISQSEFDRLWDSDDFVRSWLSTGEDKKVEKQPENMYKRHQDHLAELGFQPSETTQYLLQHFRGNVERVAYVMLLLQKMKEKGLTDEQQCVTALLRCGCNFDKACQELSQAQRGQQERQAQGTNVKVHRAVANK